MSSGFIQVIANERIPFFLQAELHSTVCVHHLFIHSPTGGHLGCPVPWLFVTIAARNTGVQISLRDPDFISFGYRLRVRLLDPLAVYKQKMMLCEPLFRKFQLDECGGKGPEQRT